MKIVAIDADIICYSVGFVAEGEPVENALHSVKTLIEKIVEKTEADDYICFLTGTGNFRKDIATIVPYKGNRKPDKPEHYEAIREYIIKHHYGEVIDGAEADDALGIFLTSPDECDKCIATLDKDLDMIPGEHYNWRKDKLYDIDEIEAENNFFIQCLTGDSSDNIPGLYKLTKTKASKALKEQVISAPTTLGKFAEINIIYKGYCPENLLHRDLMKMVEEIKSLLWIQRYDCKTWEGYLGKAIREEAKSS